MEVYIGGEVKRNNRRKGNDDEREERLVRVDHSR